MSNSYEAVGTLHHLTETQQVKDTFKKREFVLEIADGNYPQHIKFQVTQDRCALLDSYRVGQQLKVLFNLRGRPFQNREGQTVYFTNLEAWRIEAASPAAPASADYSQISPAEAGSMDGTDYVPFYAPLRGGTFATGRGCAAGRLRRDSLREGLSCAKGLAA